MKQFDFKLFFATLVAMCSVCNSYAQNTPPNDEIWYTAPSKLIEITSSYGDGFMVKAFNTTMSSHTFSNGCGVIKFDDDVTYVGHAAFSGCTSLTSIALPNSVTKIRSKAFMSCSCLLAIDIPNSVTEIGEGAFGCCSSLTSITIPNSVTDLQSSIIADCPNITSVIVEKGNSVYDSRDCCNAIIETATNTLIAGCKTSLIPNTVDSIGDYAFEECTKLTSITIPNSVVSIGEWAFNGCTSLTSITIPKSVKTIKEKAFQNCDNLETVSVCWNKPIEIPDDVFDYNTGGKILIDLKVPETKIDIYKIAAVWKDFYKIQEWDSVDIEDLKDVNSNSNNTLFNLRGQCITSPKKGEIYIQNGKKVIF